MPLTSRAVALACLLTAACAANSSPEPDDGWAYVETTLDESRSAYQEAQARGERLLPESRNDESLVGIDELGLRDYEEGWITTRDEAVRLTAWRAALRREHPLDECNTAMLWRHAAGLYALNRRTVCRSDHRGLLDEADEVEALYQRTQTGRGLKAIYPDV